VYTKATDVEKEQTLTTWGLCKITKMQNS